MSCDLLKLATPGVAGLKPYHPGKSIQELERELNLSDIVKLASNENPIGSGERAREALKTLSDYARYPDGNGFSLKATLAQYHGVEPDQITLGNGSNDILELIGRAVVTADQEVIFSEHAFAVYPLVAQAIGAKSVIVPAKGWAHDLDAMQAAVTENSRLMFIANPNNPTGTWLRQDALRRLLESVPEYVIVVVDEAYYDYVQNEDYPQCIDWLHAFPNLVVTRTFSKAHGLAGLRIGYGLSHPDIADLMNRVRQPFNVNSAALVAAEAALHDVDHIRQSVTLNQNGMQQLIHAFDQVGLDYIPSAGNFICVDLKQTARPVYEKLLHEGVIVRPVDNYGMPNHLRITIGLEAENEKFIKALNKVINE